jgi:hypothetical protein
MLGLLKRLWGVPCWDPVAKQVQYRWRSELDPSFIPVVMRDHVSRPVWVKADDLQPNEYQHPPFSDEVRALIRTLMANLRGVYDLTLEAWEDGFRRDANPNREIAIWLVHAERLRAILDAESFSDEDARQLFRLMMEVMNHGREFRPTGNDFGERVGRDVAGYARRLAPGPHPPV